MLKFTKFILILLVLSIQAQAQHWSYVYIQGDKETPFYVKLEGEMLPRYSKNYYIIPQLEEGPIHIQILFQQNIYPPQSFTIQVPQKGNRSFLLTRKNDAFSLYDLQQKTYLQPGVNEVAKVTESKETPIANNEIADEKSAPEVNINKDSNSKDPAFINNIELNNSHAVAAIPEEEPITASPQKDTTPPAETNYNIAQEKTVSEMPVTNPTQEETTIPQPTVKQQVDNDYNNANTVSPTQEQTQTTDKEDGIATETTEQEPVNNTTPTTANVEKDFSKVNDEVNSASVQEPTKVETPTTTEQTTQEPVNNITQTEPTVEKDVNKVNIEATEEKNQTDITPTTVDQQPLQTTNTPQQSPIANTEQPEIVPSSEVIKAEQEYFNAHKATNTVPENNNEQIVSTPPSTDNTVQETPPNTVQTTTVESSQMLPPPPAHPTSYYKHEEEIALSSNNAPIANSACPIPVSEKEFDKIYSTDKSKSDGKDRLKFLMKQADENCFTTRQVYFLAKEIGAESMRYSFLKKVYAHVTDQQNFKLLEDNLFKTLEWKSYFRTIQ